MSLSTFMDELGHGHRYQLVDGIKSGAFGCVALAKDTQRGSLVALKFVKRGQSILECAEAEVLNHSRLRHPHIIALHEVFLTDNYLVMVMDYAAGGDLHDLLPAGTGLPEAEARWLFQQVLFALDYSHAMGVASRDVKLENILVDDATSPQPLVKLADFGLSTDCSSGRSHLRPVGTPGYMAPEIVLASLHGQPYEAAMTDVWSCGVLLFTLVTGTSPFQRVSDSDLAGEEKVKAVLQRILRLDYSLPSWLSEDCRHLIASLLEPDTSKRPSIRQVMQHPWCCEGLDPTAMLQCNNSFVARSLASPPAPELIYEVRSILEEACMGPEAAGPRDRLAKAPSLDSSSEEEEEEEEDDWLTSARTV